MKYLAIILLASSCASKPKVVKKLSWTDKKRECHSYYMEKFGLSAEGAIKICNAELKRKSSK